MLNYVKLEMSEALLNLASIGPYVFVPEIFKTLCGLNDGSKGEIQVTYAINIHAEMESVETVNLNGRYFDPGSLENFLGASTYAIVPKGYGQVDFYGS
jgi:UTP-glucose-1-phosphate uridylyltransferase